MKANSLSKKGLSLSQAQSISNLCNQRAKQIDSIFEGVNNCEKRVTINGQEYITVTGKELPIGVTDLLQEKASLHACQAFLMENIKAKDEQIKMVKAVKADVSSIIFPEKPEFMIPPVVANVDESFGWEKLTVAEYNEYLEAESYASHIGQFIHKGGLLDSLRNELPKIPAIEWMNVKDTEKTPVKITKHHKSDELLSLHEKLAAMHREYEQRVNYFKAKVKNLTTEENAAIAKANADNQNIAQQYNNNLQTGYQTAFIAASEQVRSLQAKFEESRQAKIKELVSLKINVDERFQAVVEMFLPKAEK